MPAEVQAFVWLLLILVTLVALFIGFAFLRRYFRAQSSETPDEAFTLADLRSLLKHGKITNAEFEQLKQHVIAVAKSDASSESADSPRPTPPSATR